MKLFHLTGKLSHARVTVKAAPQDQRNGYGDATDSFSIRHGRLDTIIPAFDATCATNKAIKSYDGIISDLHAEEITGKAFHPAHWDENAKKFKKILPSYCDTVPHPEHPQHVRMASVHLRLNAPSINSWANGYKLALNHYNPRFKPTGKKFTDALKLITKDEQQNFTEGYRAGWNKASITYKPKNSKKKAG